MKIHFVRTNRAGENEERTEEGDAKFCFNALDTALELAVQHGIGSTTTLTDDDGGLVVEFKTPARRENPFKI